MDQLVVIVDFGPKRNMGRDVKGSSRATRRGSSRGLLIALSVFVCTYISCLVTPIVFCIEQEVVWGDGITVFLMVCDVCFAFDFYVWYKQNRSYFQKRKLARIPRTIVYDGLLRFVGFSSLYLVPLASVCGVNGRDQAWLTFFRMVSALSNLQ